MFSHITDWMNILMKLIVLSDAAEQIKEWVQYRPKSNRPTMRFTKEKGENIA
jgi:hypothetical protein